MSLEQALAETTAALKKLTAVLTTAKSAVDVDDADEDQEVKQDSKTAKKAPLRMNDEIAAEKEAKKTSGKKGKAAQADDEDDATDAVPDYELVRKATFDVTKKLGREASVSLLGKFNAAKGQDLKPAQYQKFIDAAKVLLSGGADEDDDLA